MSFTPENLIVTANPPPSCTCGRSPFDFCTGLHSLSEEEAKKQLDTYYENSKREKDGTKDNYLGI